MKELFPLYMFKLHNVNKREIKSSVGLLRLTWPVSPLQMGNLLRKPVHSGPKLDNTFQECLVADFVLLKSPGKRLIW